MKKVSQSPKSSPVKASPSIPSNRAVSQVVAKLRGGRRSLLARRPHRSFRRTRRRDYVRSLRLPGYWSFTNEVRRTIWRQKRLFLGLAAIYALVSALFIGIASQDTYTQLSTTLRDTSADVFTGGWGEVGKAGLLLASGITGGFNAAPNSTQQMYGALFALLVWLTTVWLLRSVLAGRRPLLRDGLYNAGAPILPTMLVGLALIVQLLPAALAAIGLNGMLQTGLLDNGVEAMVVWVVILLLVILSLYWITSTLIALVVVTLPGMYPWQAIKTAGDLVIGRRLRILWRLLWLGFTIVVIWVLVMLPVILFDAWLKSMLPALEWLPFVPVALLALSSLTVIWAASYVYLLYRKVVDDDAKPA